jgi:ketose-bisphosphate aldolase
VPFVEDGRSLIRYAFGRGFSLAAFNVCSAEMVRACVEAAEEASAPIIVQTYPTDLEQVPAAAMAALVRSLAARTSVPVLLHLDHGRDFEMAMTCLRAGYGSVMFDGAERPFVEVVAQTSRIVEVAHAMGASVEVAADSFNHGHVTATRAEEAARLFEEAGADMVAVSVGSEHGRASVLDLDRLREVAERVGRPLVLHGGSGIPTSDLVVARALGVVKVNIGSALYRTLRSVWEHSADAPDHRAVYARAREQLKTVALERIRATGAGGEAVDVHAPAAPSTPTIGRPGAHG